MAERPDRRPARPGFRRFIPGLRKQDGDTDVREEIEFYLELRTEELMQEGLPREAARREAEAKFGDRARIEAELTQQSRREARAKGRMMMFGRIRQDVAFAFRSMRRKPGFALVAVATLGLAIAGNTAIFTVVDAALLESLPFADHEDLVFVNGVHRTDGGTAFRGASFPEFRDWREGSSGFALMAAVTGPSFTLTGGDGAERVAGEVITQDYFAALEEEPALGRTFLPEEHTAADPATVVTISHELWSTRFGGDPDILGSSMVLNDTPYTVVGVMKEGFAGTTMRAQVWMPESIMGGDALDERGSRFLNVVGRLADGTAIEAAQGEMDGIARDLQEAYPLAHEDRFAQLEEFREAYLGPTEELLWVLLGSGLILLLIACANVANLLLVRAHSRARELVLRRAVGAGKGRIVGQLLTESFVLALVGGAVGLGLSVLALSNLVPMIPDGVLPPYVTPTLNAKAFLFCLTALAVTGVVTGIVPAISSARADLGVALRAGGGGSTGGTGRFWTHNGFVVCQVGLALVLLVGGGLLTRSFWAQLAVDVGAELEPVLAFSLDLPPGNYPDREDGILFASELQRRLSELPGVAAASVSSDLPLRNGSSGAYIFRADALDDRIRFHRHSVSPSYFETLGIPIVEGRGLTVDDVDPEARVAVVTEALVRRVFPEGGAVGRTLYLRPGGELPMEIVGVIQDTRYRDLTTSLMAEANSPDVFFPFAQLPTGGLEVAVRVDGDPTSFAPAVRNVLREMDAGLPLMRLEPLMESYRMRTATPRFAAFLMGLFSGFALLLASLGLYGVLAFSVGQRAREIAVRRAIGASAKVVAWSVLGRALALVVTGLILGGIGAAYGSSWLETLLYEVEPNDPRTFATVIGMLLTVAMVSAALPTIRALRNDPAAALAAE